LNTLQRQAENVNRPVPFDELFPPEFMRRYTNFKSIEEMLGAYGTPIESAEPSSEFQTRNGIGS